VTVGQNEFFSGYMDMRIETISKSNFGDRVISTVPTGGRYYYFDGAYKQVYSGGVIELTIYPKNSDFVYTKFVDKDTLYAEKISLVRPYDQNPKMLKKDKSETILNHVCKEIILTTDFHSKTFIYSSDLKIDPKHFKNYINDNRDIFATESGSLPLKYVYDNKDYKMSVTVTSYKQTSLDIKEFELPKLPIKYWD
jgi:hypothetical protein